MARQGGPEAKNLSEAKRLDRRFDRRAFLRVCGMASAVGAGV